MGGKVVRSEGLG